jgi:selenocysteine lyase/cysteine desulfurase
MPRTVESMLKISGWISTLFPGTRWVPFLPPFHKSIEPQILTIQVYGPHISMLYGRQEVHSSLSSLGHYFNPHSTLYDKLGLAASNYELTQSIPHVLNYLGPQPKEAWATIREHEEALQEVLLAYLRGRADVTIYGESSSDGAKRVPTVSFGIAGVGSKEVVERVEGVSNFGFRWGAFYSNRLADFLELGPEGAVRVSMVHYNTCKLIVYSIWKWITDDISG